MSFIDDETCTLNNKECQMAIESYAALAELRKTIEASKGNISLPMAKIINVVTEHFSKSHIGAKPPRIALENFSQTMGKRQSISAALESIGDTLYSIVKTIIEYIKKGVAKVKSLFSLFSNVVRSQVDKLDAVKEEFALINSTVSDPKINTITDQTVLSFFLKDNAPLSGKEVIAGYKNYLGSINKSLSQAFIEDTAHKVNEVVLHSAKNGDQQQTKEAASKIIEGVLKTFFGTTTGTMIRSGVENFDKKLPFGNMNFQVTGSSDQAGLYDAISSSIKRAEGVPELLPLATLEVLSRGEISTLLKAVEEEVMFGFFKNFDATQKSLARIQGIVEKNCNEILNYQAKGQSDQQSHISFSVGFLKNIVTAVLDMITIINKYSITCIKNIIEYCSLSIAQYSKE